MLYSIDCLGLHQHDSTRAELGDGGGTQLSLRVHGRDPGLPRHDDQRGDATARYHRHQESVALLHSWCIV